MFNSRNGGGFLSSMPPVTRNLIIINLGLWLVEVCIHGFGERTLIRLLGLHYAGSGLFNPVQIFTYMFLHDAGNPMHVIFNMFTLWMFGRTLEMVWGSKRFFLYYMVCGIGAALLQQVVWALTWQGEYIDAIARLNGITPAHMRDVVDAAVASGEGQWLAAMESFRSQFVTIGASGAVFGLLLGFAFVFPDMPLYLFFIPVPIKAKYMVIGYGVIEFFLGMNGMQASVAHFAHLGGMLFGLVILLYWKRKGTLRGGGFF